MTDIRQRLQGDLKVAMKARDTARLSVVRTALSAIANAEAVDVAHHDKPPGVGLGKTEVPRKELTSDDITAVLAREHDELIASAEEMDGLGQAKRADELRAQAALFADYISG